MFNQTIETMQGRRAARLLAVLSVAFAWGVLAADVIAQSPYPAKPIRLVVPFTPGGGADLVARVVGQQLAIQLGQPVIVDNRPGAGGNIGAEIVAKAPADGYTLLLATLPFASNPGLYKKPPFDPSATSLPSRSSRTRQPFSWRTLLYRSSRCVNSSSTRSAILGR